MNAIPKVVLLNVAVYDAISKVVGPFYAAVLWFIPVVILKLIPQIAVNQNQMKMWLNRFQVKLKIGSKWPMLSTCFYRVAMTSLVLS
ncbi:hypothetical protein MKW98_016684 [Papaver atlanticum]|uniref:Uncharacterized protein n=1 Tax=Papaver atlanticum TaxID=357466 RepID=A0AAD4SU14_9MAGN|nr:hypothetical protein MKW98_016684 [Papaver atlanticum]